MIKQGKKDNPLQENSKMVTRSKHQTLTLVHEHASSTWWSLSIKISHHPTSDPIRERKKLRKNKKYKLGRILRWEIDFHRTCKTMCLACKNLSAHKHLHRYLSCSYIWHGFSTDQEKCSTPSPTPKEESRTSKKVVQVIHTNAAADNASTSYSAAGIMQMEKSPDLTPMTSPMETGK